MSSRINHTINNQRRRSSVSHAGPYFLVQESSPTISHEQAPTIHPAKWTHPMSTEHVGNTVRPSAGTETQTNDGEAKNPDVNPSNSPAGVEIKVKIEFPTEPYEEGSPTIMAWKYDSPDEDDDKPSLGLRPSHSSLYIFNPPHRPPRIGASVPPSLSPIAEVNEAESPVLPTTIIHQSPPSYESYRPAANAHGVLGLGLLNIPEITLRMSANTVTVLPTVTRIGLGLSTLPVEWPQPSIIEQQHMSADNPQQWTNVIGDGDSPPTQSSFVSDYHPPIIQFASTYSPALTTDDDDGEIIYIKIEVEQPTVATLDIQTSPDIRIEVVPPTPPMHSPSALEADDIAFRHTVHSPPLRSDDDVVTEIKIELVSSADSYPQVGSPMSGSADHNNPGSRLSVPLFQCRQHADTNGTANSRPTRSTKAVEAGDNEITPILALLWDAYPEIMGPIIKPIRSMYSAVLSQVRAKFLGRGVLGIDFRFMASASEPQDLPATGLAPSVSSSTRMSFAVGSDDWMEIRMAAYGTGEWGI